ncbi:unnamed protein product [Owenia fusiformis]|uniref:Uncharacterized protein n=1 Tax=Owenia fusiformis TaxID=6347 RepID=A0A8S4Q6Y3_OWEFU|nr:unnamed protein product [Owenia fusiformis]
MQYLTWFVCFVVFTVAVTPGLAGKKGKKPPGVLPPRRPPKYDTSEKGDDQKEEKEPTPKLISSAQATKCGYKMYTLTSKNAANSKTDALFSIQFWRWVGPAPFNWASSSWIQFDNVGDDKERGQWDLYGPYISTGLPADYLYIKQTSSGSDPWQVKNIFIWNSCADKLYMYFCDNCWVTTTPTWIARTYPPL